jgi:flagellar biosynthesis protein FlhG
MKTIDQAARLGRWALGGVREAPTAGAPPPRLIAISGSQFGAGATTLAVNLSVALTTLGTRCVLVDADWYRSDVAACCGLNPEADVTDVLNARRDIHEVFHRGPAGIPVVPGFRAGGHPAEFSEFAQLRLLRQLHGLGRHAEAVVVDLGNGMHDFVRRFWIEADMTLLVVNRGARSLMDGYANIQRALVGRGRGEPAIHLVVNRAADRSSGEEVHRRINTCCRRFLGLSIGYLGQIPEDAGVPAAAANGRPYLLESPGSAVADALESLAEQLAATTVAAASTSEPAVSVLAGHETRNLAALSPGSAVFGR